MPLNIDWQQILLHLLNVALLFGILYFLLYSPVKKFMNARIEEAQKKEQDVSDRLAQAEEMKKTYEDTLSAVDAEMETKKQQAFEQLSAQLEADRAASRAQTEQILTQARAEAQKEHDEIVASAQKDIADMATALAAKVVGTDASDPYDTFLHAVERGDQNAGNP